jgi:hypothetical protein
VIAETLLHLDGGEYCRTRGVEDREETVSRRVDLATVVVGQPGPDDAVVIDEDLGVRVTQAGEFLRRSLDVGEEEGEGGRGRESPMGACGGARATVSDSTNVPGELTEGDWQFNLSPDAGTAVRAVDLT